MGTLLLPSQLHLRGRWEGEADPPPPSMLGVSGHDFCPTPAPSEGEWDFYWCDVSWLRENFDHTYMDEHVRISHFRNHYEVSWEQGRGTRGLGVAASRCWFGGTNQHGKV